MYENINSRTYSYEDWEKIHKFFNEMNIPYDEGEFYGNGEKITGHWIELCPIRIQTEEISELDRIENAL